MRALVLGCVLAILPTVLRAQTDGPTEAAYPPYLGPCADKMNRVEVAIAKTIESNGEAPIERITWIDGQTGARKYMFRFGASASSRGILLRFTERSDGGCTLVTLTPDGRVQQAD
jgi:hypothetical protein